MTMANGTCCVEGCPKPPKKATGPCPMHAERKRTTGEYGPAEPIRWRMTDPRRPVCSVDGCDGTAVGESFCTKHLQRFRRSGDPLNPYADRPGVIITRAGYRHVWKPDHPLALSDGYVAEHRMVVYDSGTEVPDGWHVHHINGDKLDNRRENLEPIEASEHHRQHIQEQGHVVNQFGTWPLR